MEDYMTLSEESSALKIGIPLVPGPASKARWKNKTDNGFGEPFKGSEEFKKESYLEWQIGYDFEIGKGKKSKLAKPDFEFVGANTRHKYPFELPEILFSLIEIKLINKSELEELRETIESYSQFIEEENKISNDSKRAAVDYDGIPLMKGYISLPYFVHELVKDGPSVEISIQKQQHAAGVQAMVYLCIPFCYLDNYSKYLGRTRFEIREAENKKSLYLTIDSENKSIVTQMFEYFSICSRKHKHDISEILRVIDNYCFSSGNGSN